MNKERKCKFCKNKFVPKRTDKIFCTHFCGSMFWKITNPGYHKKPERVAYIKEWNARNVEHRREYKKNWENQKRLNPSFRLKKNLCARIRDALRGENKSAHTMELIGCTVDELWGHLESQFKPGMTRDNHGFYGWHIDHIRPLDSFTDFTEPAQQREAFHYTNLQPLWAKENWSKNNKYQLTN